VGHADVQLLTIYGPWGDSVALDFSPNDYSGTPNANVTVSNASPVQPGFGRMIQVPHVVTAAGVEVTATPKFMHYYTQKRSQ
jgi:hypothetical protein